MPGELALHRADAAENEALAVMLQFTEAAKVPDRWRKSAELEQEAAAVQEALTGAVAAREAARKALAEAEEAEKAPLGPLGQCRELAAKAAANLEEAECTCQGRRGDRN
jgi:hypothetical protein